MKYAFFRFKKILSIVYGNYYCSKKNTASFIFSDFIQLFVKNMIITQLCVHTQMHKIIIIIICDSNEMCQRLQRRRHSDLVQIVLSYFRNDLLIISS
jgi:hypothetical protein